MKRTNSLWRSFLVLVYLCGWCYCDSAQEASISRVLDTPFTLTYKYSRATSGFPPGADPNDVSGIEGFLSKDKSRDKAAIHKLLRGPKLITVSGDGTSTVYECTVNGNLLSVVLFIQGGMRNYSVLTNQATILSPGEFTVPYVPMPPLMIDFPRVLPFYIGPRARTSADNAFGIPGSAQLVKVLRPGISIGIRKLPYQDAAYLSSEHLIVQGPPTEAGFSIRFSKFINFSGFSLPTLITQNLVGTLIGPGGKAFRVGDTESFTLVKAVPSSLKNNAFQLDSYLKNGAFLEDGKRGARFKSGGKSAEEQLTGLVPLKPSPKQNSAGFILGLLCTFAVVVGASILTKRRLRHL